MAYTTIDDPSANFQAKTFSGNAGTNAITFDGNTDMQPDLVWLKKRNGAANHHLVNSVRGAGRYLYANLTNAEGGDGADGGGNDLLASFNSNGFTIDAGADSNASGATGVAWSWKAGTSFTNDASATGIGTIDSTGSFNNDSGFSIVSYTGTGSNGTIKHGLNTAPSCIITKSVSAVEDWGMYHVGIGNTSNISLNKTNAKYSANSAFWNNTNPTSSVFTVGTHPTINYNTKTMIACCFAEKQGYSKFGSYTANNSSDGTFIYTGFKPSLFICKKSSGAESWYINDNKRGAFNPSSAELYADNSQAEGTGNARLDLLSNGIKMRTDNGGYNTGSETYIYMAFAESPFVSSTGVPTTAR